MKGDRHRWGDVAMPEEEGKHNSLLAGSIFAKSRLRRDSVMDETLKRYRESIDNIDAALVFMLAERFKITQAVGRYKAEHALPAADPGREDRQIARLRQLAADARSEEHTSELQSLMRI